MEMSQHKQTKDNSHSWNKQTNATMVLCHKLWWINITLIKCTVKKIRFGKLTLFWQVSNITVEAKEALTKWLEADYQLYRCLSIF